MARKLRGAEQKLSDFLAEKTVVYLQKEVLEGRPASPGYWYPALSRYTAAVKGTDKIFGVRTGSLFHGIFKRRLQDGRYDVGIDHPAAKFIEFGHTYVRTWKQFLWMKYNYTAANGEQIRTPPAGKKVNVPPRPLLAPVIERINRESEVYFDYFFGDLYNRSRGRA